MTHLGGQLTSADVLSVFQSESGYTSATYFTGSWRRRGVLPVNRLTTRYRVVCIGSALQNYQLGNQAGYQLLSGNQLVTCNQLVKGGDF